MTTQIETGEREVVLLGNAHIRPMMGLDVLEPLPSRTIPYSRVDPFILVHDTVVPITEQRATLMEVPLLFRGEPGIRKSVLLKHASWRAADSGFRTLATVRVESEAEVARKALGRCATSTPTL